MKNIRQVNCFSSIHCEGKTDPISFNFGVEGLRFGLALFRFLLHLLPMLLSLLLLRQFLPVLNISTYYIFNKYILSF